ncbi:hypothetical protein NA78x_001072 [Anatilimnocola sp. NA78]|uniref:hypothetical protein n=1 Tax=Anatilimnocola sp. NA78 TaxID=3415683 RepID=UPI003CE480B0
MEVASTPASETAPQNSKRFRRYPKFSLRTLLIAITLIACLLGWSVYQYRLYKRERDAVAILVARFEALCFTRVHQTPGQALRLPDRVPVIDLAQLRNGRIYRPIEIVVVDEGTLDDAAVETLRSFHSLKRLTLIGCDSQTTLDPIAGHNSLRNLIVARTRLHSRDIDSVVSLTNLRSLSLGPGDHMPRDCAERISGLHLTSLTLDEMLVSDTALKNLTAQNSMECLSLPKCTVSRDSLLLIGRLRELIWLDLSGTKVDDRLFTHFTFPKLEILDLADCPITDEGVVGIVRNKEIIRLVLRNTQITDRGVKELAKLPKLLALDISGCKITNEAQKTLDSISTLDPTEVVTGLSP